MTDADVMIDRVGSVTSYDVDKLPFYLAEYLDRRTIRLAEICMFTTYLCGCIMFHEYRAG